MTSMIVMERVTFRGGRGYNNPPGMLDGGLPAFLTAILRAIAGAGVVLVDRWAAAQLGLPVDELPASGEGKRHPAAVAAREAGWEVDEVHRWSRFRRGGSDVRIGLLDHIDSVYCPLIARGGLHAEDGPVSGLDTGGALDAWQRLSGMPYWGDPGDAVNSLIMCLAATKLYGKPLVPAWRTKEPDAVRGQYARTFHREGFNRLGVPPCQGRWLCGYDATRAYLSAMTVAEVAPLPLRATGRREFDPKMAGWWLVDLCPWTDAHMPAPWGYYPDGSDVTGIVPLTTPDLVLLDQLREAGRYGGYTIVDSYTNRGDRQVLRPAADRLRAMWDASKDDPHPDDGLRVRETIVAGYQAAHSKWRSSKGNGVIQRSDWSATLGATARTNLWRRVDTARQAGRYPAFLSGIDTVWFTTDDTDMPPPPGIVTDRYPLNRDTLETDRLGTFRLKYVLDQEASP